MGVGGEVSWADWICRIEVNGTEERGSEYNQTNYFPDFTPNDLYIMLVCWGGCLAAKNGEQVAVRDDREEPGAWILARVIKYVTETHHYEVQKRDLLGECCPTALCFVGSTCYVSFEIQVRQWLSSS